MNENPNWSDSGSKWERFGFALFGSPIKAILSVIVGIVLIVGLTWGFRWISADTRGEIDAREQILADGDFRIAAYQSFYAECGAIRAQEARANILALDGWENDPISRTNVQAVLSIRAALAETYNESSTATWTAGQFRDEDLPYTIESEWTPGEDKTECAS
jgi:hypothetical protein